MNRYRIGDDGWADGAARSPSPNFDTRAPDTEIRLLVIHNISLPPGRFGGTEIEDLFCNRLDCDAHPYFDQLRTLRVSAHFLIRRDGTVIQFVSANDRAWHAGASTFCGRERCNDFSIGIELEGTDFEPFDPCQYAALAELTQALAQRYPLTDVAGHEHIAPGRKTDPGPFFDWEAYRKSLMQNGQLARSLVDLKFPS
ncbi:MAG TPA: 1,6-anhydro-N-acetylmuramyl-L-alanine amidase AmpD [Noviherbaspirillum sp.]|uniref:1,6-anhydro-N-acetylmuramyl-L-alanine amidase AmpD n=1 Tax=Noviherbaspirillum sp. TaxID=1926288 RepID=UPI002D24078D|nr:1,6-anhydro-N-acetylmuramyl-L-alanine amidase AmpD [Noviherbaspirillum sp.]HYD95643.1 1,6-anhydro-N-acetylmuramyl-L-alanine amidase AmpD [Noviherbaspirillum sp.]